jgi:triacylglycerol lipase
MPTISDFLDSTRVDAARDAMANIAKYAMFAEDMYVDDDTDPPGDLRFGAEWTFVDWLRTTVAANLIGDIEHVLFGSNNTTYFGALFQSSTDQNQYLVSLRGTESGPEWIQNFDAMPDFLHGFKQRIANKLIEKSGKAMKHSSGGYVSSGFYGVYDALTLGRSSILNPPAACKGIVDAITQLQTKHGSTLASAHLTITGHSLGAAVSTYLAYDLATQGGMPHLDVYLFASPMAGDDTFTKSMSRLGAVNWLSIVYERDIVPMVPPGYAPLIDTVTILTEGSTAIGKQLVASAQIDNSPGGNHHVICYAAMLSPTVARTIACYNDTDKNCVTAIKVPGLVSLTPGSPARPAPPW